MRNHNGIYEDSSSFVSNSHYGTPGEGLWPTRGDFAGVLAGSPDPARVEKSKMRIAAVLSCCLDNQHLDSTFMVHHDVYMRTTVTLDQDVERMLRDAMHRTRSGFKETLNAAIRTGLGSKTLNPKCLPFVIKARTMGLRAGLDPAGFNKLADELEVDSFLMNHRRPSSK
jgi:hypothetical protein